MILSSKVIVHLTSASEEAAGKVTYDMHRNMLNSGLDSWILTSVPGSTVDKVLRLHRTASGYKLFHFWRILKLRLGGNKPIRLQRNPKYHFKNYAEEEYYTAEHILRRLPDVIDVFVIHFYDGLLNAATISRLGRLTGARMLWLMMDMAPLTGGCHYAWDCLGYTKNCGVCPALLSKEEYDRSREQLILRKLALENCEKIELIAASEWQVRQAKSSMLFGQRIVHKVLTAVDPDLYYRRKKSIIHEATEGANIARVVFFGARYLNEERKGFHLFVKALTELRALVESEVMQTTMIFIAGEGDAEAMINTGWKYKHFGKVTNSELAEMLGSSHLYVCASIEDSGPTMINQAIMSGTPVVSFEMGVALDLVINNINGITIPVGNVELMSLAIARMLRIEEEDWKKYSENCRNIAEKYCNPHVQTDKWRAIAEKC